MKKIILAIVLTFTVQTYGQSVQTMRSKQYNNDHTIIAQGNAAGKTKVGILGVNSKIGTSRETIWEYSRPYIYIDKGQTIRIVCKSANDDTSGTGARTMKIFGLDSLYAEQNETLTLSGTDTIETANKYVRVFRLRISTGGSTGLNADSIWAFNDSATDTCLALMLPEENRTQMALYTVPLGKTFYMTAFHGSQALIKQSHCAITKRPFGAVWSHVDIAEIYLSPFVYQYSIPEPFSAKTDIEVHGSTVGGDGSIAIRLVGWIE